MCIQKLLAGGLMTLTTEFYPGGVEHALLVRTMGAVALQAVLDRGQVGLAVLPVLRCFPVTGEAEQGLSFLKDMLMR